MDSLQVGQSFMRASRDSVLEADLNSKLSSFENIIPLPGISEAAERRSFVRQLVDSIRRIKYVTLIRDKSNSTSAVDPIIGKFNPIKAAAFHCAQGNYDEASWLVFLITHFGKNKFTEWQLVQDVYGTLGTGIWAWQQVCLSPDALGQWIDQNASLLKSRRSNFGNHRKYQSLNFKHTGKTIISYVDWIGQQHAHAIKFSQLEQSQVNPQKRFRTFYNSMQAVHGFGRTARFDYLAMMGKLQLIDIEPDSVYMKEATGPYAGGQLLFTGSTKGNISREDLDQILSDLNDHLCIAFGMQVLEDALCNWQKNPKQYIYFRG
jgi:hypothetical protein